MTHNYEAGSTPIRGLDAVRAAPGIDDELYELTARAGAFHGHLCPGLAVGILASRVALERARRAIDEELVAVVENDACGVDGIQALTGCTFGKGNLVFRDHGKSVYTFHNRTTGAALRLALKPDVFDDEDPAAKEERERFRALFSKVRAGVATDEENAAFWAHHIERTIRVLERGSSVFDIRTFDGEPPEKARIFDSVRCAECGEPVMATRTVDTDGRRLCIPCAKRLERAGSVPPDGEGLV